jgi:hypothetical protein
MFKFVCALLFLLAIVQNVHSQCAANEGWSACGNLCENSCANILAPSVVIPFIPAWQSLTSLNPNCVAGCYCLDGWIRKGNQGCVLQTPNVCGAG